MVNSMVARATNSMLIGPDWAMNLEICDICDRDPVQAKDVVKGIKKQLGHKKPKVQLLALTLLESIVKNCGDIVHLQVAERSLLSDMVKIVKKKKADFHVKEKILILIDTWQEDFGGERGRYPQYYVAYLELLRLGASFPEKPARSAPVVIPPQTQAITPVQRNPEIENEEAEFPTLSLSEMQNARGVMDVLAEMLTAVNPENKEGLRQDVIVDLVEQCRTYKRRLVHLVNSTSNESLLSQGLALNDELQRVLAKHEALLNGPRVISTEKSNPEKSNPETSRALVPVTTTSTKQPGSTSGAEAGGQPDLITLAPATSNGKSTEKVNAVNFDLLSGDDFDLSTPSNSLAIVPVGETQPATPVTQQNSLALVSVFSPQTQQPQNMSAQQPQNMLARQQSFYQNVNGVQNQPWVPFNQGNNNPVWNGQMAQQQQQQQQQQPLQLTLPGFGADINGGLPAAPWEAPPAGNINMNTNNHIAGGGAMQYSQPHGLPSPGNINMNTNNHMLPMNNQPLYSPQIPQQQMAYPQQMGQQMYANQMGQQMYANQMGQQMYANQMAQQMYANQMGQQMYGNQMGQVYGFGGYGNGYGPGLGPGPVYGYGQQQNGQFVGKSMPGNGMAVRDESFLTSSVYTGPSMANASYVHVGKTQKTEDKMFGDLVDFSKVRQKKTAIGERV